MVRATTRLNGLYGAGLLHLVSLAACFVLAGYAIGLLGLDALWDSDVWWQSILVWFVGAAILHDLVLFPAYALADYLFRARLGGHDRSVSRLRVPPLNYVRLPLLGSGLLLLLFYPGILQQGESSYLRATGQDQEPFLERWLLLTAVFLASSAIAYGVRHIRAGSGRRRTGETA